MMMRFFKTGFLLLFSCIFLWAAGFGVFVLLVLSQKAVQPDERTDAIIVLTGGDHRITTGLNLFAMGLAPKLYISGVNDGNTLETIIESWPGLPPEGKRALPACCMEMGAATTTVENAIETQEWVAANNIKTARLVTSAYHMPRALLEFENMMPDLKVYKYPVTLDPLSPQDEFFWHITFSEYHKAVYRFIVLNFIASSR